MPLENIYADGSIMYNIKPEGSEGLSECYWSLFNDIHEDEDMPADLVKSAKDGKEKYWRYLTPAQAKTRRRHLADVAALATGDEEVRIYDATTDGKTDEDKTDESKNAQT